MLNTKNFFLIVRKVAILQLFGFCVPLLADEVVKKVEIIGGKQVSIEYRLNNQGQLVVRPYAVMTPSGWQHISSENPAPFDKTKLTPDPAVVEFSNRVFSVRFSDNNGSFAGSAYASRSRRGDWQYLEGWQRPPVRNGTVAEVQIRGDLLEDITLSSSKTDPFYRKQNLVHPDISVTARPNIVPSTDSFGVELNVDVNGTTTGTGSRRVGRRGSVGATVTNTINANFSRTIHANENGITLSPLEGTPEIRASVQPFSNLPMGIGRRQATRQAHTQLATEIPEAKAEMTEQVHNQTTAAASTLTNAIQTTLAEANDLGSIPSNFPFRPHFSSEANENGSNLRVTLHDTANSTRSPRPESDLQHHAATSLYLHEDVITSIVSEQLKGKRVNLGEAMKAICDNKITAKLAFCREDLDPKLARTTLIFDQENPFSIKFRDGLIKVEINATHLMESENSQTPVIKGNPYRIGITYEVNPDRLVRKQVSIEPSHAGNSPVAQNDSDNESASLAGGLHSGLQLFNRAMRYIADPIEKEALRKAYSSAFKEQVDFPDIAYPTRFHANNPESGGRPQITDARTLVPLDALSQDGWFLATNASCDGKTGLGINFRPAATGSSSEYRVTAVNADFPAAQAGIAVGDKITSYKVFGDSQTQVVTSDWQKFSQTMQRLSSENEAEKRIVTLEGVDRNGQPFSKTIALCPAGLNSVANAQRNLERIRSNFQ